jgi:hypothetical protein
MRFTLGNLKIGRVFKRNNGKLYYLSTRVPGARGSDVCLLRMDTQECWVIGVARILNLLNNPGYGFKLMS